MENLSTYYIQVFFITLIVVNHLFEIYLSQRQLTVLEKNRHHVPDEFSHFLNLQDHQKAIHYASSKLRLGQAKLIWNALLLFYWFPGRGAENLYLALPFTEVHQEVWFLASFGLISFMLNLPWSIYSTFYLEEKFGFNRTTPKIYFFDILKGLILSAILGLPLLYGILFIFQFTGKWWWSFAFLFFFSFQLLLLWIYPKFIAPLFNQFKPLEQKDLKRGIEELVTRAGFKAKEVFTMDASKRSSHGNAYFTGLGKNKRVVFFDTLLNELVPREIFAILAHELGHMKFKHIPKAMATSTIISFCGFWLMGMLSNENWFYTGHFLRAVSPGALLLLFTQVIPLYLFWFSPFGPWISRKREFEADEYAARQTSPDDLISSLLKLYQKNAGPVVTDKIYSIFYHSHPPALERIKKLESFKGEPSQGLS